jgi:hypothetical protein
MQTIITNCFRHCSYGCELNTDTNSASGTEKWDLIQLGSEKDVEVTFYTPADSEFATCGVPGVHEFCDD